MTVGQRIKILRGELEMKQGDFARTISIKQGSLSQIESGITNPSDITIDMICRVHSVNKEWLLSGKGEIFIQETATNPEGAGVNLTAGDWYKMWEKRGKEIEEIREEHRKILSDLRKDLNFFRQVASDKLKISVEVEA